MAESETSEKRSTLKLLLVGIGILLLLALLGGGALYGWQKWQTSKAAEAASPAAEQPDGGYGEDEEDADYGEAGSPAVFVYKNNVNLEGRKNAYLVVELNILFRDQELGRLVTSDKPTPENSIMRAITLDAISGMTLEEATDLGTRESIRENILERLNERFAPKRGGGANSKRPKSPVREVLVVSWAIAQ